MYEVFYFLGRAAEQGEPYGPVVEQLSLEKEQSGAPTIWANYKTCDFSLCVLLELSIQQSSGGEMEFPVCSHLASYTAALPGTPWTTSWAYL